MAKFNIEVELDWINEDSIDEVMQQKIINGIQDKLTKDISAKMEKQLSEIITNRVKTIADAMLQEVTKKSLGEIQMPVTDGGWGSKVEFISLTQFIGKRFEKFMTEKKLDERGNKADYSRDAKYTISEYLLHGYLEKELLGKVTKTIEKARTDAEKTVVKTLEENLQAQLSADIINRLNIPLLLENLQSQAVLLENKK
ncbi:MAG: hypothetical protein NAG76_22365 [Candidatus Pristimantibacillus lignocellulolyticus]|uniref:Uncharacterized protein n=1 Tax=Candidatus Pristimantibacillus lignocellulolyticus TaxID=2994561 RepID=A0A9J6ZER7_9BACL|nr:MAG: hypothetical protein NAG76_22365 [Candidatus Pristimantibacillus lignocellulolyticus]